MFAEVCAAGWSGTTDATGIASILMKIASGSASVTTSVVSSRTVTPEIDFAVPALNSRAPLIGKEELRGAALRRRVERSLPAVRRRCAP